MRADFVPGYVASFAFGVSSAIETLFTTVFLGSAAGSHVVVRPPTAIRKYQRFCSVIYERMEES
jgi:hypothetical protein